MEQTKVTKAIESQSPMDQSGLSINDGLPDFFRFEFEPGAMRVASSDREQLVASPPHIAARSPITARWLEPQLSQDTQQNHRARILFLLRAFGVTGEAPELELCISGLSPSQEV